VNLAAWTLSPRGMSTPSFTPKGEPSQLFRRMEGQTENFTPRGQNSPLGDKFAPGVNICPYGWSLEWASGKPPCRNHSVWKPSSSYIHRVEKGVT
jgi:hypothetical protein